jgi:hypothetical protein
MMPIRSYRSNLALAAVIDTAMAALPHCCADDIEVYMKMEQVPQGVIARLLSGPEFRRATIEDPV